MHEPRQSMLESESNIQGWSLALSRISIQVIMLISDFINLK